MSLLGNVLIGIAAIAVITMLRILTNAFMKDMQGIADTHCCPVIDF